MTQTDKLNRVNKVIELAQAIFTNQGIEPRHAFYDAEKFLEHADEYREIKRKEILTGKEVNDAR